jgi:hypothetical protein
MFVRGLIFANLKMLKILAFLFGFILKIATFVYPKPKYIKHDSYTGSSKIFWL